jgi:hypothetical protein
VGESFPIQEEKELNKKKKMGIWPKLILIAPQFAI